jgi:hypothetical protein
MYQTRKDAYQDVRNRSLTCSTVLKRVDNEAEHEGSLSYVSFKRLRPGAINTGFNLHRPTQGGHGARRVQRVVYPRVVDGVDDAGRQGLTLVHNRAQLEQLQDTFMS